MGEHVDDERVDGGRLAFGLDFYAVGAPVANEAADVVARRGSADRLTKENALNETTNSYLPSLAHIAALF